MSTCIGSPGSTKVSDVPQLGQNQRVPLAKNAKLLGSPRDRAKQSAVYVPQATTGAPAARWHVRQQQQSACSVCHVLLWPVPGCGYSRSG
jgi:hypothetical protein